MPSFAGGPYKEPLREVSPERCFWSSLVAGSAVGGRGSRTDAKQRRERGAGSTRPLTTREPLSDCLGGSPFPEAAARAKQMALGKHAPRKRS